MIELKKSMLAVLAPLVILSLAPAGMAGNEPAQVTPTTPKTQPAVQTRAMDRPEMAPFKRIQMFAIKYRQKLMNMQNILEQAKRTGAITAENHKKLQDELARLNEVEPSLARGGWNQTDIDAFDKQIARYQSELDKANAKGTVNFSAPTATTSTVTKTTKSKEAKGAVSAPAKK